MRRKWVVHQHREEEARAGGGWGTGPGEKEAWLEGSTEDRKAKRLKINYTHSASGGAKQHLPERQRHLSTTRMRTGSTNFLPPEWSHPSIWVSTIRALLWLREGSGLENPTLFLPRWERGCHVPSADGKPGWQQVSFPLILDSQSQVNVLLPSTPVIGKGDPRALTLVLAGGAQPLHQGTLRLSSAMDQHPKELHIFSPVNVTSYSMQGCSKIHTRMVPEDTQHKQEFMPLFSTAWLSVEFIPHPQSKVLIPFPSAKTEFRSSLCLCSVFMSNWTEWQEPLNAPKQDIEAHGNG